MAINIILICGAILGSAFISAAESALLNVRLSHIQHLSENGDWRAASVVRILERYENFFATILLIGNLFNILVATASTNVIINSIGGGESNVFTTVVATAFATVIVYIVGELTPKTLGAIAPEAWSLAVAHIIHLLMRVFAPIVWVFTLLPRGLLRLFGESDGYSRPGYSQGELSLIIDQSEDHGTIDDTHGEMLDNLIDLGALDLRDHRVRVHNTQIVWLNENDTVRTFLQRYRRHVDEVAHVDEHHLAQPGFIVQKGEPLPVPYWYRADQLAGAVFVNDVLKFIADGGGDNLDETLADAALIREDIVVRPETTHLDDLLTELISHEKNLAVSVNSDGNVNGVVTLAGILEMIWGDHDDTLLEPQYAVEKVDATTYLVPGALSIERTEAATDYDIPLSGRYETIAGFFLDQSQRMPQIGDVAVFDNRLYLEITAMDGVRIDKLLISDDHPVLSAVAPQSAVQAAG